MSIPESELKKLNVRINNHVDANVYSLNNEYLTQSEKLEVEMWYQFPLHVMHYTLIVAAYLFHFNYLPLTEFIVSVLLADLLAGIFNWYFYIKKLIYLLSLTIFHTVFIYLAGIGSAVYFFLNGAIILGIVSLLPLFGFLALFAPSTFLYNFLSIKYRMHPKYAFFKKEYEYTFPFEKEP